MTPAEPAPDPEELQECALRCRLLAEATCKLADEAEEPYVIAQYLKIAIKLTACANAADRGLRYRWPPADE